jgi:hypothetical protein
VSIFADGGSGMNSPFRRACQGAAPGVGHGRADLGAAQHAGLHERHEGRGGVLVHLDRRVLLLDRVEVGVRADRGRRRDDTDPPRPRGEGGGLRARADDAEDWRVVAAAVLAQGHGGRGVAGDHQGLDVSRRAGPAPRAELPDSPSERVP